MEAYEGNIIDFFNPTYYKYYIFHVEIGWSSKVDILNLPGIISAEKALQVLPYQPAVPMVSPLLPLL